MKIHWAQIYKIGIIFVLSLAVLVLFLPFSFPLALGGVFCVIVFPFYKKLLHLKINRPLASLFTLTIFFMIFLVPAGLVIYKGASVTAKFFVENVSTGKLNKTLHTEQQESMQKIDNLTQKVTDKIGVDVPSAEEMIDKTVNVVSGFVIKAFRDFFAEIPDFVVSLFIAILTMYFGLVESEKIKSFVLQKSQLTKENAIQLMYNIEGNCRSVVLSNFVTGALEGLLIAGGAHFGDLANFFVVGFITFVMSFVPVVGTIPISLGLAGYGFLTGHSGAGITMIILTVIVMIAEHTVRPMLLSGTTKIHSFLGLLAILGGIILFGLPGLIIGPLVFAIAVSCLPIYYRDYNEKRKLHERNDAVKVSV